MAGASRMALVAATLGMAAMAGQNIADIPRETPATDYFPGSRRFRKPTSNKHRGDARKENRPKNKAAKRARGKNRK